MEIDWVREGFEILPSSLAQHPVNSLSFMAVSLIDVQARQSYPLQVEQRESPGPVEKPVEPPAKRKHGRPKDSKNHVKPVPKLILLQGMIKGITARIAFLTVNHIVLDDHFGNYPATYAVRETGLHIISKQSAVSFWQLAKAPPLTLRGNPVFLPIANG